MTDEPTKAAIERACEITGYSVPDYHWQVTEHPKKRTRLWNATNAVGRHLVQVSETAKVCAQSATADAERYRLLQPFILPDPEPDVLAELLGSDFELTWAGHEASADDLRTELAKRGYAITKTGEAGQ